MVADSILSVDLEVALLHVLVAFAPNARWLLHAEIIERLCGNCRLLVTNSDDSYFLSPGNQYFQRLLGFQINRLEIVDAAGPAVTASPRPAGISWPELPLTCGIAPPRVSEEEPALAA